MNHKKTGKKIVGAESKKKETGEDRMHKMEKAMHGKNMGKGFKGYGSTKGMK